jgi:hypothetical protein
MLALRHSVKMKLQRLEEEVTTSHKSHAKNSCQKRANSDNCAPPASSTVRRSYFQTDAFRREGISAIQRNLWPIFRPDQVMRALKINVPKSRATRRITSSQPCHISDVLGPLSVPCSAQLHIGRPQDYSGAYLCVWADTEYRTKNKDHDEPTGWR